MPTLLAFDTAAAHCAAVLVRDGRTLGAHVEAMERGQAEALMPLLREMLRAAGIDWPELDAIGVGIGPGNFTGTRIAVAAARGLAMGLSRPAIGISAFETMRLGADADGRPLLVSLEAPRGRAYVQAWRSDVTGDARTVDPAAPPADLAAGCARVVGHRAAEMARALGIAGEDRAQDDFPAALGRAVSARFASGAPASRPAPLYMRPPDAAPPREAPPVIVP